jgi:hypothetical protein
MSDKCQKCGTPIAQHEGRGRPSSYCSTSCRRAAEHEIRRLDKHITMLEARIIHANTGGLSLTGEKASVHAEIERLELRLRELLGGASKSGTYPPEPEPEDLLIR